MSNNGFTPTQQRMLAVLSDGLPHTVEELLSCIDDTLASKQNVQHHVSDARKVLRPRGQDVICEWVRRRRLYRWVRLISADE